jgi:hypothetical protein
LRLLVQPVVPLHAIPRLSFLDDDETLAKRTYLDGDKGQGSVSV